MGQGKISPKQQEILEYIKSQILERGFPPAVRDICEAVHIHIWRLWKRMATYGAIQPSQEQLRSWMILLTLCGVRW